MIKVGDVVIVHPKHSFAFGKRRGRVVEVETRANQYGAVIKVTVDNYPKPLEFVAHELITESTAQLWESKGKILCSRCGEDITGDFDWICEECAYPPIEEG